MRADTVIDLTPERIAGFWAMVSRGAPDDCWEWTGERHIFGYGVYSERGRSVRFTAHRLALVIAGVDVTGMVVRHDCDNPPCVNPRHLRTGTQADNIRDAVERGRMDQSGLSALYDKACRACGAPFRALSRRRYCDEHRYSPPPRRPRVTHCPQGHEYTPENTYNEPGGRKCRTCVLAYHARRRAAARAEAARKVIEADGLCRDHLAAAQERLTEARGRFGVES